MGEALSIDRLLALWENILLNTRAVGNSTEFGPIWHSFENVFGEERCARATIKDDLKAIFDYYAADNTELDAGLIWGVFARFCCLTNGNNTAIKSKVVCALVNADQREKDSFDFIS